MAAAEVTAFVIEAIQNTVSASSRRHRTDRAGQGALIDRTVTVAAIATIPGTSPRSVAAFSTWIDPRQLTHDYPPSIGCFSQSHRRCLLLVSHAVTAS